MAEHNIDDACGRHLTYRDLIACGETQARTAISNLPTQAGSWEALRELSEAILDPVIDTFGPIELTFGFCSRDLYRAIPSGTSDKLDQHHAHEINRKGDPVCDRLGAAADFRVTGMDSLELARWVVTHLPWDRLYFYGTTRPIHVSYGPDHSRQIVLMKPRADHAYARRPISKSADKFLGLDWDNEGWTD